MYSKLIASSLIAITAAMTAAAQESATATLSDAEALAVDAAFYSEAYGVSLPEAMTRMAVMHDPTGVVKAAIKEEVDSVSGVYFDNSADFALILNKTGESKPSKTIRTKPRPGILGETLEQKKSRRAKERQDRKAIRQALKLKDGDVELAEDVLQSGASLRVKVKGGASAKRKDLLNDIDRIYDVITKEVPNVVFVAFDDQSLGILLFVDDPNPTIDANSLSEKYKIPVQILSAPGGFVETGARGGSPLRAIASGVGSNGTAYSADEQLCMTGFVAEDKNYTTSTANAFERYGALTAAHCLTQFPGVTSFLYDGTYFSGTSGADYNVSLSARTDLVRRSNYADVALIKFPKTSTAAAPFAPEFYANSRTITTLPRKLTAVGTRASVISGTDLYADTNPNTVSVVQGSYICKLGQTTGANDTLVQSCGEVISTRGGGVSANGGNAANTADPNFRAGGQFIVVQNTGAGKGTEKPVGQVGTLRCAGGDSGGPWFANNVGYGVSSACAFEKQQLGDLGPVTYAVVSSLDNLPSGVQIVLGQ